MTTDAFKALIQGIATTPKQHETSLHVIAPAVTHVPVSPLALPLYDFQQEAVEHVLRDIASAPYGYIGLDMGLGKTPCGVAVTKSLKDAGVVSDPVLVVVPPSLRINWAREFYKFAPTIKVAIIRSSKPAPGDVLPNVDVIILGDSSIAGWADFLTGKVGALIVDEAHRFKNTSKRSAALAQVATGVKRSKDAYGNRQTVKLTESTPLLRVLMSGTPVPNGRHTELAPQIDVMGGGAWKDIGGKGMFWHRYAPTVDAYGGRASLYGEELFTAMSSTWFFRRLRDQVLDLPNKGRTSLHLEGTGKAVKEYKQVEKNLIDWLAGKQDGKVSAGQIRAKALLEMMTLRRLAGVAKIESVVTHVKELLDEQPGGVFVVAEHREVMDGIMLGLAKYNPTTVQGGMNDADKADNVDRFCSGESRVMVGQITAAGVGLTLHGGGINHHVVVAQLPWTPADLKQAEDRLHRIGQTHDVTVEVALAAIEGSWTIDERLWGMVESKNFASTTLTDGLGEFLLSEVQDGLLDSYRS